MFAAHMTKGKYPLYIEFIMIEKNCNNSWIENGRRIEKDTFW